MRTLLGVALLVVALTGCGEPGKTTSPDQCMRREIFQQCMKVLPAGPQATKYNDWDEVVAACETVAFYQSLRDKEMITEKCRT